MELWIRIQDLIGEAGLWPLRIRRLFWLPKLNSHFSRYILAAFAFINGFHPETQNVPQASNRSHLKIYILI